MMEYIKIVIKNFKSRRLRSFLTLLGIIIGIVSIILLYSFADSIEDLVSEWDRPYSREQACYPAGTNRVDKYWPAVGRIDNVFGDRNLICTCPPLTEYLEAAE